MIEARSTALVVQAPFEWIANWELYEHLGDPDRALATFGRIAFSLAGAGAAGAGAAAVVAGSAVGFVVVVAVGGALVGGMFAKWLWDETVGRALR